MSARAETTVTGGSVAQALRGGGIEWRSSLFQLLLLLALLTSFAFLMVLLVDVFSKGFPVLQERGTSFLTSGLSSLASRAGVWQGLIGSFAIALGVVVFSVPLGVAAAIYLEEYATDTRWNRFITVNIRNLAGVPAIVYGILGVVILVKGLASFTGGPSMISGVTIMSILVLPIVIITASEALRAVPASIREAGYGVGATKWEVIRSHVLPSALPGILTGTVLSISRALGETAPLLMIGAITGFLALGNQSFVETLQSKFTTLPTLIFGWSRQPSADFRESTSAAIVVLLVLTLSANAIAIFLRNRHERKW